ncbi:MAG: hypothetical protein IJP38_06760 [Oscillospiraceae bacterium]|nr:hypothetical protein [Oscillospiraceae bacterium]
MKKLLSIILAAAMLMSLIPSAFAEGVEQELMLSDFYAKCGANAPSASAYTDGVLSWKSIQVRRYNFGGASSTSKYCYFGAMKFTVTAPGDYNIHLKTDNPTGTSVAPAIYIGKYDSVKADAYNDLGGNDKNPKALTGGEAQKIGYFNFSKATTGEYASVTVDGTDAGEKGKITLAAGDYYILFTPDMTSFALNSTAINGDSVETLTERPSANTYKQEMYLSGMKLVPAEPEVVLPEEKPIEDTTVNFKASAYEGGAVSNAAVQAVTIGSDVTVTATPNTGYTFAYWKNSAGVVLSTNATETFKVSTNMGVIAVFDAETIDTAIPVQFYNGNGMPLGSASVAKDTTFGAAKSAAGITTTPTLTGYVFSHWSDKDANVAIEDNALITALTRAVAIYEDDANTTYTVTVIGKEPITGKKYGESVTVNGSENFTAWKLGDKVISYEKDYTFDVYGNITLTEVTGETMAKAPVLVLDKVGENYFLTYDEGDYELIEAGILFGSENVSIGSIDGYKAAAKRHTGQFTAQPHEGATSSTIARGYMICKYNDEFKVIYAD